MEDKEFWDTREFTLESCGIAPGPLDAYRGTGKHAKTISTRIRKPEVRKEPVKKEVRTMKVFDIAGNEILLTIS
jgi:hypothetical protein